MKNMKNIDKALTKAQDKLINIAKTKGIYENFGLTEVRKLEDTFIDRNKCCFCVCRDYSETMNRNRRLINLFENWCMNYSL